MIYTLKARKRQSKLMATLSQWIDLLSIVPYYYESSNAETTVHFNLLMQKGYALLYQDEDYTMFPNLITLTDKATVRP